MMTFVKKIFLSFMLILPFCGAQAAIPSQPETVYPAVVLGSGVGGLTSAIYLGRAGLAPLVIEGNQPGGAITQSHSVQNWPGELNISGLDLAEKIRAQAEQNGAKFLAQNVVSVDFSNYPYTITTQDLNNKEITQRFKAKTCIIALGSTPNFLGVPGEKEYFTKGVYNCAVCDGGLYKGKTVAVIGGGDSAVTEAHYLSKIAKKVWIIVRKDTMKGSEEQRKRELLATPNVEVLYETTTKEMKGNGEYVTHLVLNNTKNGSQSELPVDGVFLAIGATPNTSLFKNQLELDGKGYISLIKDQETSKPGVFSVGDISDPHYKQAVSGAGEGAKAALQAERFLALGAPALPAKEAVSTLSLSASTMQPENNLIEITSLDQFNQEIRNTTVPVVVDFYASWCGPCRKLSPLINVWAQNNAGKIKFLKVNVDVANQVANHYQIRSMPTVLLFNKNGELVERKIGLPDITRLLEQFISQQQ